MLKQRILLLCGVIAPIFFILIALLGGALRPGYSHMSETVSELFAPGSPNKLLLDILHSIFALLLIFFGFGILGYVRQHKHTNTQGRTGAWLYIAMGFVSLASAVYFPIDAWGSPPTSRGQIHMILHGIISLLTLTSMLFIGSWFYHAEQARNFRTHSYITVAMALLGAAWFIMSYGGPHMGLVERITALIGFQWIITLALRILSSQDSILLTQRN
jgi:hypothetical protein